MNVYIEKIYKSPYKTYVLVLSNTEYYVTNIMLSYQHFAILAQAYE